MRVMLCKLAGSCRRACQKKEAAALRGDNKGRGCTWNLKMQQNMCPCDTEKCLLLAFSGVNMQMLMKA